MVETVCWQQMFTLSLFPSVQNLIAFGTAMCQLKNTDFTGFPVAKRVT